MPTEEKMVDLDTSGEGAVVNLEEQKDESVVETEAPKKEDVSEEPVETKQEEVKEEPKKDDEQLEEYSKGVQGRIAKLTRKMREAERQRDAATEYAKSVEQRRQALETRFEKTDADYIKKFETSINTGLEAAQKELAAAISAGDAEAQVQANKRIATLAFENAKLEQSKSVREEKVSRPADVRAPEQPRTQMQEPSDPRAESWASKNSWFGQDRAMTYTAFEIHKDLVEKEGFDPNSNEYYVEVDKRIRVDFPHKFATTDIRNTTDPVQTVASARRSVRPGRKTVKLTSSQVAIAKKLGVPLEEYAKQLKNTGGA
jgi:murein DD-endopeptidase MepM/ murein hydrolase activator NlpD